MNEYIAEMLKDANVNDFEGLGGVLEIERRLWNLDMRKSFVQPRIFLLRDQEKSGNVRP